jgi:hypothetical protein
MNALNSSYILLDWVTLDLYNLWPVQKKYYIYLLLSVKTYIPHRNIWYICVVLYIFTNSIISAKTVIYIYIFLFVWRWYPTQTIASLLLSLFDHTQRLAKLGRTPLDEWSARRKTLYITEDDLIKDRNMLECFLKYFKWF